MIFMYKCKKRGKKRKVLLGFLSSKFPLCLLNTDIELSIYRMKCTVSVWSYMLWKHMMEFLNIFTLENTVCLPFDQKRESEQK
jgi:hypothetical protein